MGRFWETSSDCLTERQLRHEHRHRFWWKSGMIPIFLLNDCSSCQQFPLLCLFPFPRSSVTRERDEKRSARSWNLRVISRTQQAVKTDNRSSHSLSLSLSLGTRARQINRNSNAERNVIQKYSAGMHVDKNIHTQTGENKPADVNIRSASCSVSPS